MLNKEAFDHAGLIYGMGHAVYTLSDPREVILKRFAQALAEEKGMTDEFELYDKVEGIAGKLIMEHRKLFKECLCKCRLLQWICIYHAWYPGRTLHSDLCHCAYRLAGVHTVWKN